MMELPGTSLGGRPGPHLGSGNLWNIFFLYGGQRDHPLLGSGPSGTLSGDLTVYLCQALTVTQNGEAKTSYIYFLEHLIVVCRQRPNIFFPLINIWDWVLGIENENWLSNPLFKVGVGGGGVGEGLNHWQERGDQNRNCILLFLHSQSLGYGEGEA